MTAPAPGKVVVSDADVLINFLNVDRLDILTELPGFAFFVPDHVDAEILREDQRRVVERSYDEGKLQRRTLTDLDAIEVFADLRLVMGRGEAAWIALARKTGWFVVSDERGVVRRKVAELLGPDRLVTTPGIIVLGIRAGLIAVDEADRLRAALARHRFRMRFDSFREVLGREVNSVRGRHHRRHHR